MNEEAFRQEMADFDLTTVTREEVEACVAHGIIKQWIPDKFLTLHLAHHKPPRFEVKSFVGQGYALDTENMQAAIEAYNRTGLDLVTQADIESHINYGLVKLAGVDKMFVIQWVIHTPPHYVVRDYSGKRVILDTEDMQAALEAYNQAPPHKDVDAD